ncbi:MAG: substrate-binding domain-containing protein [Nitrospirota bacterium]|nr:substrate-binding domain-containing protein [Nitrospirota bacterium]MDP2383047.1 substrate-binding domain-containing protein [Nitrospirota bacterium]MDP3599061.1 substrate-binding domain-containing protein [Nitrospirota bacterium]
MIARQILSLGLGLLFSWGTAQVALAEVAGNLIIAGNGPEVTTLESLARAFEKANPRAYLDVVWDGNSKPVEMVKSGQAHIAVTGTETPDLSATVIAWDGIGILVHLSNVTKDVTKQHVADIFSGKITMWSELGGLDTKILVIDRPRNQNIRDAFEDQLGVTGKITGSAKVIGSDEQVVKTVVGTLPPLSAITYLSLSQALPAVSGGVAVKLLPIDKIEPEVPTVKDGRYPFRRPLLLLSKKEPNPLAEAFTQFVLSQAGQELMADTYIPLKEK